MNMKIKANGKEFEVSEETQLQDFVQSLDLHIDRVVVEHNGEALSPGEAKQTVLSDGDSLEIVRIVAGG